MIQSRVSCQVSLLGPATHEKNRKCTKGSFKQQLPSLQFRIEISKWYKEEKKVRDLQGGSISPYLVSYHFLVLFFPLFRVCRHQGPKCGATSRVGETGLVSTCLKTLRHCILVSTSFLFLVASLLLLVRHLLLLAWHLFLHGIHPIANFVFCPLCVRPLDLCFTA